MSTLFILLIGAWVLLITVAFVVACVQAIVHLLPPATPSWEAPLAPTLAQLRNHA